MAKRVIAICLFLVLLGVSGCSRVTDEHGVTYGSVEALIADHKRKDQQIYESIESLSEPLADSGVFIIPEFDYYYRQMSMLPEAKRMPPDALRANVAYMEETDLTLAKFAEKRNLFGKQKLVRVTEPKSLPPTLGSEGEVLVYLTFEIDGMHIFLERNGKQQETLRPWHWNPDYPDYVSSRRASLTAIETVLQKGQI